MARPLRIEYPGAIYHVTSRGNRKHDIFIDDRDYRSFIKLLSKICKTYNWICHAYCLMPNHYHLLIETPDGNLSAGMRDLNGIYTQKYNYYHQTVGHVFQGRYKAFVIEKEFYLLRVARYTVLNPQRARIVSNVTDWTWSSYRATVGSVKKPVFLETDWILGFFGKDRKKAQKEYAKYVAEGIDAGSPFSEINEGTILGTPQFVGEIWEQEKQAEVITEIPRAERMISRPSLEELFKDTGRVDRDELIIFARFRCGYSNTDIAKHVGLHRTTVSRIVNRK